MIKNKPVFALVRKMVNVNVLVEKIIVKRIQASVAVTVIVTHAKVKTIVVVQVKNQVVVKDATVVVMKRMANVSANVEKMVVNYKKKVAAVVNVIVMTRLLKIAVAKTKNKKQKVLE